MNGAMRFVRRGLFAAAVGLALGAGSAEARVAQPCADADAARGCNPIGCDNWCRARGGFSGRCTEEGRCLCLF